MRSSTAVTRSPSIFTCIPPSPSTRASASTLSVFVRLLAIRACLLESSHVEGAEDAVDGAPVHAEHVQLPGQGDGVRGLHRPEAAVAAAVVRGAERSAAGVRDRAEAGRAVGDHDADRAAPLALR